jgi:hypothetical protein
MASSDIDEKDNGALRGGGERSTPAVRQDQATAGDQERPMSEDEQLDEALDETFPGSDPIAPSRIDKPGT